MKSIPPFNNSKPLAAHWEYHNQKGEVIGAVARYGNCVDKDYLPMLAGEPGSWKVGVPNEGRPLYGLNQLIDVDTEISVFVTEGEKSTSALQQLGLMAFTSPNGSSQAHLADWSPLSGMANVVILPDNDESGERYSSVVGKMLLGLETPPQVQIARLAGLPDKGDVVDWIQQRVTEWDGYKQLPDETLSELKLEFSLEVERVKEEFSCSKNAIIDWPTPQEIETELKPVKEFPLEALPKPLQGYVEDCSYRMGCPNDYVAMAIIVALSSLIGTNCGAKPKRKDDWIAVPNLWGAIIADPGQKKSAALSAGLRPLEKLEKKAREEFEQRMNEHAAHCKVYKARENALEKDLQTAARNERKSEQNASTKSIDDLAKELHDLEISPSPICKRYKTSDPTVEKLGELLAENLGGILVSRDELIGLLKTWDKGGREADRSFFLEAWNGDGSFTSDRIGRGTIIVEHACVSILGTIQPGKLLSYLMQTVDGSGNDGLIQRFQLMVYPDKIRSLKIIDEEPDHEARESIERIFSYLSSVDYPTIVTEEVSESKIPVFGFDDIAQDILYDSLLELKQNKLFADNEAILLEHLAKYESLIPSLALIFHLVDIAAGKTPGLIGKESINQATQLCEYLESHARRIYGLAGDREVLAAKILADKIKTKKLKDGFTVRDVYRSKSPLLKNKELARAACDELEELGWIKGERVAGKSGPQTIRFQINPKVFLTKSSKTLNEEVTNETS